MNSLRGIGGVLALACVLATSACNMHFGSSSQWTRFGQSVEERSGRLYVDGVAMPFERWVSVVGEAPAGQSLTFAACRGDVDLHGGKGAAYALEVHLYSEVEGDGSVVLQSGSLVPSSQSGRKLLVDDVRGTIPATVALILSSGTGDIRLEGACEGQDLKLEAGTGAVRVSGCNVADLKGQLGTADLDLDSVTANAGRLESGTGDMRLLGCRLDELHVNSGTGQLTLLDCRLDQLKVDTGTGDVMLTGCELGLLNMESGTGDAKLVRCQVQQVKLDSGTGDLVLDGGQAEQVLATLGSGGLKQLHEVRVGTLRLD